MWGERQRGRGQSRLVVGSTRNRLLLRFLGREGLLEVLFVVPHVYHVAEVRHAEDHERDVHDDADGDPGRSSAFLVTPARELRRWRP